MLELALVSAVTAVLIALNGAFVAAEFAIVGAPRATIASRAARGDRAARTVQRVLDNPRNQDRYIATAQLGITFASLGLGMYGEHQLASMIAHWLEDLGAGRWIAAHALASVIAVAVMTYFHIVFGEMIPKSLALEHAEGTVLAVTRPMLAIRALLYPLVVGLNGIGNVILRLMGVDRQAGGQDRFHTAEELQLIVEESTEGGLLRPESGRVLRELFEFGELTAGELMVPRVRVVGIPTGAGPRELADVLQRSPHTRYPVYEGDLDHIAGMLHVKDILRLVQERRPIAARDLRTVPYVPEAAHLDAVLAAMRQTSTQFVVVLDEHGGTAGVVTAEDLFEEVVGRVEEAGSGTAELFRDAAGRLHAAGTVRTEELGERLGVTLEHEEVDTVSGLVLTLLGRPPETGDRVVYEDVELVVVAIEGHGVREVTAARIRGARPPGDSDPGDAHMSSDESLEDDA